jgi:TolB-like protein/Tfp pilus assembly protein PilF
MASLIEGYEYDIFISYRQNDNRSGWVTDFVKHLNEALAATFKKPVTVYFDADPHDGLAATHDVGDSLKGKLKCVILIPIVSQTYCDPNSFAWRHEFLAFRDQATRDHLGMKIKLTNGNVASRILPISIHDLDATDKELVETELGGPMRAIEFIYRSPGVIRPLESHEEDPKSNRDRTYYRDQINKVSRAIKELMTGIQNPNRPATPAHQQSAVSGSARKKIALTGALVIALGLSSYAFFYFAGGGNKLSLERDRSIAVLPFENLNKDATQDYFSDGIAEDILNHLVNISDLEVKSRTSTLQYKGTTKTASVIGSELGVANLIEGSVRRVGDKVRIVVQLIDTENDVHLWSQTYDRDYSDVLALQSEIAIEIARALESRLTSAEKKKISKEVTASVSAYDYYLQARHKMELGSFTKPELEAARELVSKAIDLDPTFSNAYALRADLWFQLSSYGLPQRTWEDSVRLNSGKSIQADSLNPAGYLVRARVERFLGNLANADRDLGIAYSLNPKDLGVQAAYGYQLLRQNDERGADMVIRSIERSYSTRQTEYHRSYLYPLLWMGDYEGVETASKSIMDLSEAGTYYYDLAIAQTMKRDFTAAIGTSERALKIDPLAQGPIDNLAWAHFLNGDYEKAAEYWSMYKTIEANFEDKGQTVPFRHRLAMALVKLGNRNKANELLREDKEIQSEMLEKTRSTGAWGARGGIYYDLAVDMALLDQEAEAIHNLDSAYKYGFIVPPVWLWKNDPAFEKIKSSPGFQQVNDKIEAHQEFMKRAFTNAFNRAQASKDLKGFVNK